MRGKAIETYRILNDFVGDLVAGTRSLEVFESPEFASKIGAKTQLVLRRMCLSHLVVTLSKWAELYDKCKALIPSQTRAACLELRKGIETRGIRDFRNTVVGHIWDSKVKRPLTRAEVDTRLAQVLRGSQQSLLPSGRRLSAEIKTGLAPKELLNDLQIVRHYNQAGVADRAELGWVVLFPKAEELRQACVRTFEKTCAKLRGECNDFIHKRADVTDWLISCIAVPATN